MADGMRMNSAACRASVAGNLLAADAPARHRIAMQPQTKNPANENFVSRESPIAIAKPGANGEARPGQRRMFILVVLIRGKPLESGGDVDRLVHRLTQDSPRRGDADRGEDENDDDVRPVAAHS